MKISFSNRITDILPQVKLSVLTFSTKVEHSTETMKSLLKTKCNQLCSNLPLNGINSIPAIKASRNAYKACGKDPNRYRPAADSLLRRVSKGSDLYHVNNIVDILNYVSISSGISIGGFDSGKVSSDVWFDWGDKDEPYEGIGRGKLNIHLLPLLRDKQGPFGTPTSDSVRTSISNSSSKIAFVFYDFENNGTANEYLELTSQLLTEYTESELFELKSYLPG